MRTDEQRRKAVDYLNRHPEQREKQRIRARAAAAKKRAADPGLAHRARIYDELAVMQGGEFCKICGAGRGAKRLHVDHDHETGEIRGLLCSLCNAMLGQARDNPATLQAGIDYLSTARTGRTWAEWERIPVRIKYTKKEAA